MDPCNHTTCVVWLICAQVPTLNCTGQKLQHRGTCFFFFFSLLPSYVLDIWHCLYFWLPGSGAEFKGRRTMGFPTLLFYPCQHFWHKCLINTGKRQKSGRLRESPCSFMFLDQKCLVSGFHARSHLKGKGGRSGQFVAPGTSLGTFHTCLGLTSGPFAFPPESVVWRVAAAGWPWGNVKCWSIFSAHTRAPYHISCELQGGSKIKLLRISRWWYQNIQLRAGFLWA